MRYNHCFQLALLICVVSVRDVQADPVRITSYDITNAAVSGTGRWEHTYTGTIAPVEPTGAIQLANYSGGRGTLNDGFIGATHRDTQLFLAEAHPVITVYFDGFYSLGAITLFGGGDPFNAIPGAIVNTVTVSGGGVSAAVATEPFGPTFSGQPINDRLRLIGTPLASLLVDRISLSGFESTFRETSQQSLFSIGEIQIEGASVAPVPEPGTLVLLGTGIAGAIARRRRTRSASHPSRRAS